MAIKNKAKVCLRRRNRRKIVLVSVLGLLLLALALGTWAFFSSSTKAQGNRVGMASLDIEVTEEDGSTLAPIDISGVYPGWTHELCGKVRNRGSADVLFRLRLANGNGDFNILSGAMNYEMRVENASGQLIYAKTGHLDGFSIDNSAMNILIPPEALYAYKLKFSIPDDMDNHATPENEDDNIYQGLNAQFDLLVESTQANNPDWSGF